MSRALLTRTLDVAPHPCVVPEAFDAWSWCASSAVEWRMPQTSEARPARGTLDLANPPDLLFVIRDPARVPFLPRERANLHAPAYGFDDDVWALAPYAIDDATDLLFEHRVPPHEAMWLAAPSLAALVWGLHDWAHFHNHGPFDDPPATELACDLLALAWLRANRERLALDDDALAQVPRDLAALTRQRFSAAGRALPTHDDGSPCDVDALFAGAYPFAVTLRVSGA